MITTGTRSTPRGPESRWLRPLLAGTLLSACAPSLAPTSAPPAPQVVGTRHCSAAVQLRAAHPAAEAARTGGTAQPVVELHVDSATRLVVGADTLVRAAVTVPGAVQVLWQARVSRRQDGSVYAADRSITADAVSFTGGITGRRQTAQYAGADGRWHWAKCGERSDWAIPLPEERRVRISSDPDGASVFSSPSEWSVPEFIGTTPTELVVLWHPGQRGVGLLVRKSGHHDVRQRLEPADSQLRVILHPLTAARP